MHDTDRIETVMRYHERTKHRFDRYAPVQHVGHVRFHPTARGTRVTVRMSYRPPAGLIGHTLAALFGRDAKQELDADLMRMKAYVETGRAPHDAARGRQAKQEARQAEATS